LNTGPPLRNVVDEVEFELVELLITERMKIDVDECLMFAL
jgi:hypothetical protein